MSGGVDGRRLLSERAAGAPYVLPTPFVDKAQTATPCEVVHQGGEQPPCEFDDAVYGVAFISGLTDVDALTLSISQLFGDARLEADTASRAILLGSLSNLVFKLGIACVSGSRALRIWVLAAGLPAILACAGILLGS